MAKDKTSVIFTGDIGFDRYMDRRWEDDGFLSASVLEFFDSAEHTVANVEGALIEAEDNGSHGSDLVRGIACNNADNGGIGLGGVLQLSQQSLHALRLDGKQNLLAAFKHFLCAAQQLVACLLALAALVLRQIEHSDLASCTNAVFYRACQNSAAHIAVTDGTEFVFHISIPFVFGYIGYIIAQFIIY